MASPTILWLRQDLRLADNPALAAAVSGGAPVIPLYVLDETAGVRPIGGASRWWLAGSLAALGEALAAKGSRLILRRGPAQQVLNAVIAEAGARRVVWNRVYEPDATARDTVIKAALTAAGVEAASFNSALLSEPWSVRTGAGGAYRVFTPYWRAARATLDVAHLHRTPHGVPAPHAWPTSDRLEDWSLRPTTPDWARGFEVWLPGEHGAGPALERFLDRAAADYSTGRDLPAEPGTSRLSPHLHFGELGPRQVAAAVLNAEAHGALPSRAAETFLKELGWREFNHHLLFHFPAIVRDNFNPDFDAFAWRRSAWRLRAWRRGETGYPIVDAGMRELWTTGWMHNRVRMIVASFLTKHLRQDWRDGEAWFWDTLVDADLANNVCNWQWVAGSGADAAPFFRIFNPVAQGERFDPHGAYVRRWLPQLAHVPDALVHQPWKAHPPPPDYPPPIVDHAEARAAALDAWRTMRVANSNSG